MNRIITAFLLFLIPILVNAQNDKFIKIVGLSSLEVEAQSMRVTISLTEIKRDEYQKIRERSLEEIKEELNANLISIGYSLGDLEEIWPPKKNYQKVKTENYFLSLKTIEDAKQITEMSIKGFDASNFEYIYPTYIDFDELELSKSALKDAKRKAEALAKHVGKKVGDIINIEDKSSGSKKISGSKQHKNQKFNYSLIVTYELLD